MILSETMQWVAFVLFALLTVLGALGMTTTMSMFRSGIFLMASFIGVAGLFILLSADLIGLLQIMMYIGGMLVMILFMLLFSMDPGGAMMAGMEMSPVERLFSRGLKPPGGGEDGEHSGHGQMSGKGQADAEKPHDHAAMQDSEMKMGEGHDHHAMQNTSDMEGQSEQGQQQQDDVAAMDMGGENKAHTPHDHAAMKHSGMVHAASDQEMPDHDHAAKHGDPANDQASREAGGDHGQMEQSGMDHGDMDMGGMDMSMVTPARPWAAWLGIAVSAVLVGLLLWRPAWPVTSAAFSTDSPREIGTLLMGKYMMAFEGAGMLILLGIFGAVMLQRPGSHPSDQGREAYVTSEENPVGIVEDEP